MTDKKAYFQTLEAAQSTITRDMTEMSAPIGNVYETVAIIAKRANEISTDLKKELDARLQDFAVPQETIEEVFENKEQIDISRQYEVLPKPTLLATEEFLNDKLIIRNNSASRDRFE